MRKEHSAPLQALIWLLESKGQAEAGFLPWPMAPLLRMSQRSEGEDVSCIPQPVHTHSDPASCTTPRPTPPHLQVAGGWGVVDLDVAVVGAGQQLTVTEPRDSGTGVGKHLAGDVHLVPLPRVHSHGALQLGGICKEGQRPQEARRDHGVPHTPAPGPGMAGKPWSQSDTGGRRGSEFFPWAAWGGAQTCKSEDGEGVSLGDTALGWPRAYRCRTGLSPQPCANPPAPRPPAVLLTLHFEVHGLGVLADGVAGSADVLPGVGVLDALQGQGGHAGVAAHHHVPVQGLPGGEGQRQGLRWAGLRPGIAALTSLTALPSLWQRLGLALGTNLWKQGSREHHGNLGASQTVYPSGLACVPRLAWEAQPRPPDSLAWPIWNGSQSLASRHCSCNSLTSWGSGKPALPSFPSRLSAGSLVRAQLMGNLNVPNERNDTRKSSFCRCLIFLNA